VNFKVIYSNGKTKKTKCISLIEVYSESILYALVNKYPIDIKSIENLDTKVVYTDFNLSFKTN
jgi:hypothetical protein